ncbi:MAG: TIGR02530 family flagellar biosynthesis protein [Deltaproteobacteria bacterium]
MVINNRPVIIPSKPVNQTTSVQQKSNTSTGKIGFGEILKNKIEQNSDVKVSKHAELRMNARNIKISEAQMERIKSGVDKAQEKGVKDSLMLVDNIALVVNVKNRTIVTAANTQELKENVFTNIDGAVIV